MTDAFVSFENVSKVYRTGEVEIRAADSVTFSVRKGEFVIIVGPSGALDYQTGKAILKLLQDTCREKGVTVIVITHNSALTPMADRVIRIRNGTVAEEILQDHPTPVEQIEW